ncbi:telomere length and silencing protein 1 homolog [Anthonomus grandis grandis]|uniref:telomere length and silencing protein 1 homolog n=1 Tax=Anthonomus grandis grandis TaxID=2921223 RepID=UPI002166A1FF|nr:telomere length and silencing protein 1 homolog [Anthonomus grandis grandis]
MDKSEEDMGPKEQIIFKPKKRKNLRQKIKVEESDEEDTSEISNKLGDLKEVQNLRKRPHGVSVIGLALGTKISAVDEVVAKDPFKVQTGGMVNMQALKSGKVKQVDDAYDTGIGTQFSVETNKRDEDEEMMRYIEDELSKRKGKGEKEAEQEPSGKKNSYLSPEEAALQAVPEHLRESSAKRSEEMLSNQMLSGIPEVDLGIEAKIRNIEATEEAKLKLFRENQKKKDGPSQFVPTNMAVNFVQHNRFNTDQGELAKKKRKQDETQINSKKRDEKATDDYHFETFKKQFRR